MPSIGIIVGILARIPASQSCCKVLLEDPLESSIRLCISYLSLHNYIFAFHDSNVTNDVRNHTLHCSPCPFRHSICCQLKAKMTLYVLYHTYTRISWHFRSQRPCLRCVCYNFRCRQDYKEPCPRVDDIGTKG